MYNSSTKRSGLKDIWNAFMVKGASFSDHDIPLCPTTASTIPTRLIAYDEAKSIHSKAMAAKHFDYRIDAFVHFYIDDQKFDGKNSSIWLYPEKALEILKHFAGIIAPDFSTYADFPEPLKRWNFYRMNSFGYWTGTNDIPTISNSRWGFADTWEYCFDGNPHNSMIAIGTVASGLKFLSNRELFENGLFEMVNRIKPHTIIVYGSVNYECFKKLEEKGIKIISFPSKTSEAFKRRKTRE